MIKVFSLLESKRFPRVSLICLLLIVQYTIQERPRVPMPHKRFSMEMKFIGMYKNPQHVILKENPNVLVLASGSFAQTSAHLKVV